MSNLIEDISPLLPQDIVEKFSNEFGIKYPNVKKPNITNGLSPVLVNKSETSDFRRRVSSVRNQMFTSTSQGGTEAGVEEFNDNITGMQL